MFKKIILAGVILVAWTGFVIWSVSPSNQTDSMPAAPDTKLCGRPYESEYLSKDSETGIVSKSSREISECTVLSIAEQPKNSVYRYSIRIENDWNKNIGVLLSDWRVIHSPFTQQLKSFTMNIPACSYISISFLSHSQPELRISPVNVSFVNDEFGWVTSGTGRATIIMPVELSQYHSEGVKIGRLTETEIKSGGCKTTLSKLKTSR